MTARAFHRNDRRGGALATTLIFMVLILVAGSGLLSISLINRMTIVRNSMDVRLVIAAEAGIETMRGRFTLVRGVQDDWSFINLNSWTTIGTPVVNGLPVTVEARAIGGPSVPTARVRSIASAGGVTRVVEYFVKVATFSDYAVFTGTTASLGQNYKAVGNVYTDGNIRIGDGITGAQMLGNVTITGIIDKGTGTDPDSYIFPLSNPLVNQQQIPFPTWAAPWDALEDVARNVNHIYSENTIEIELRGDYYVRWYVARTANGTGNGTVPSGTSWINQGTGATNYFAANNGFNNSDYQLRESAPIPLPDEGVIYIKSGPARLNGPAATPGTPTKDTEGPGTNNFTQRHITGSGDGRIFTNNYPSAGTSGTPVMLLSGTLANTRVSIASDHKIIIKQPIKYQSLLDTPEFRRFYADGSNGKEGAGALGFKEMLGVMAQGDIHPAVTWWSTPLTVAQSVADLAGEYLPGHFTNDTYCMDGVYMSLGTTAPVRNYGSPSPPGGPRGEMWFHGGLIAQGSYGGGHANSFFRRNYDWDYRMRLTCPPYFLRAYNTSAVFIPGTWRSYEL